MVTHAVALPPAAATPPPDGVPAAAPPWPAPCFASTPSDPGPTPSGRLRAALRPAPLPGGGPGCGHCWPGLASGPCPARPAGHCDRASVHEPGPQGLSSCAAVTRRRGFTFPRLQPALALYPRPWLLSRAGFPPSSAPTTLGPAPRLASKVQEPGPCEHQGGGAEAGGDHRGEGGTGVPQPSGVPLACCTPVPAPGERLTAPTQPRGGGTTYSGDDSGVRLDISSGVGTVPTGREGVVTLCPPPGPPVPQRLSWGRTPHTVGGTQGTGQPHPLPGREWGEPSGASGREELSCPLVLKSDYACSSLQPALLSPER